MVPIWGKQLLRPQARAASSIAIFLAGSTSGWPAIPQLPLLGGSDQLIFFRRAGPGGGGLLFAFAIIADAPPRAGQFAGLFRPPSASRTCSAR